MSKRTAYHRAYYWKHVERRREQRVQSKHRAKLRTITDALRAWGAATRKREGT